jgi:hypothetical protein
LVEWWVVEVGGGEGGAGHEMIRGMSRSLTLGICDLEIKRCCSTKAGLICVYIHTVTVQ